MTSELPQHPYPDRTPEPYKCLWCFEYTSSGDLGEALWADETGKTHVIRLHDRCTEAYMAYRHTLASCKVCGNTTQLIDGLWCSPRCEKAADERIKNALKAGKIWMKDRQIASGKLDTLKEHAQEMVWVLEGMNAGWISRPPTELRQAMVLSLRKMEDAIRAEEEHNARNTATGSQMQFSKAVNAAAEAAKKRAGLVDDYLKGHGVK